MAREQVFYSFHYDNDVFRVQQIRNMGVLDGDEPVSANAWESIKAQGARTIEKWIDDNMKYKRCVVVLIGEETAQRRYVQYEIQKAWEEKRGLLGIFIHNLKDPRTGLGRRGPNPFDTFSVGPHLPMSSLVRCHDPSSNDAYGDISRNLGSWVDAAIGEVRTRTY